MIVRHRFEMYRAEKMGEASKHSRGKENRFWLQSLLKAVQGQRAA